MNKADTFKALNKVGGNRALPSSTLLARVVLYFCVASYAGNTVAKFDVNSCVAIISRDGQEIVSKTRDGLREKKKNLGSWVKVRVFDENVSGHATQAVYGGHLSGDSIPKRYSYYIEYDTQTPVSTPADTPMVPPFPSNDEYLPRYPVTTGNRSSGGSSRASTPFSLPFVSATPSPAPTGYELGTLYVQPLGEGDVQRHDSFHMLNTEGRSKKEASLCEYFRVDSESPDVFQVCCGFEELDSVPNILSLIKQGELSSTESGAEGVTNDQIQHFLEVTEDVTRDRALKNQEAGRVPMYKKGDSMDPYPYSAMGDDDDNPIKIPAKVIGIGTSTVVYRYGKFIHVADGSIYQKLNDVLPRLAFRRIYFTNARDAEQFHHHQLAQVKFLERNGIAILPVRFWKSRHKTVLIAQPFLNPENLLETYFEKIDKDGLGPDDEIEVLNKKMSVNEFLGDVTKLIIEGVQTLNKLNASFLSMGRNGQHEQIIESFLDAKYPNYAIFRDGTNNLSLQYFDLFPAHLLIFGRNPKDSNGHTQYEIFDRAFFRPEAADKLVKKGMVNGYKEKLKGYSDLSVMLQKLAASSLDLVFQNTSFADACRELDSDGSRRYQLVKMIVNKINAIANNKYLSGEVTLEEAITYWKSRVKKNMLLRLALHFLTYAKLLTGDEDRETQQVMSATSDEQNLMDWAEIEYQGSLRKYIEWAQDGLLGADELIPVLRGMVEVYIKEEHLLQPAVPIVPVYDIAKGVDPFIASRPLMCSDLENLGSPEWAEVVSVNTAAEKAFAHHREKFFGYDNPEQVRCLAKFHEFVRTKLMEHRERQKKSGVDGEPPLKKWALSVSDESWPDSLTHPTHPFTPSRSPDSLPIRPRALPIQTPGKRRGKKAALSSKYSDKQRVLRSRSTATKLSEKPKKLPRLIIPVPLKSGAAKS